MFRGISDKDDAALKMLESDPVGIFQTQHGWLSKLDATVATRLRKTTTRPYEVGSVRHLLRAIRNIVSVLIIL